MQTFFKKFWAKSDESREVIRKDALSYLEYDALRLINNLRPYDVETFSIDAAKYLVQEEYVTIEDFDPGEGKHFSIYQITTKGQEYLAANKGVFPPNAQ